MAVSDDGIFHPIFLIIYHDVTNARYLPDGGIIQRAISGSSYLTRRRTFQLDGPSLSAARSIEQAASSLFALGGVSGNSTIASHTPRRLPTSDLPGLSREVTVGRNSRFYNLTPKDRERLGGIEYRSLKLLLKIVIGTQDSYTPRHVAVHEN